MRHVLQEGHLENGRDTAVAAAITCLPRFLWLSFAGFRGQHFFLSVPQFGLSAGADQAVDHLIPVNEDELPAYQAELQGKLSITPADIARMIVRPAWRPEFAVSVYSTPPASAHDVTRYKATVTRASSNSWFAREPVQTIRRDAELPASVALRAKGVWKQELLAARSHDHPVDSPVDGAIVEFALLEPNKSTLRAELPMNPAGDILSLENLGTLLVNYCQAATDEQNVLAKEIEKTAKSLLKKKADVSVADLKDSLSPWAQPSPVDIDAGDPPPRYRLVITDNPVATRFDLTLVSYDARPICLSARGWPDRWGHVDWGREWVKLQSKERSFPARDWDFGVCEGDGCSHRLPPNGILTGFISYAEFGDLKEIAALPDRRLLFETTPCVCSKPRADAAKLAPDPDQVTPISAVVIAVPSKFDPVLEPTGNIKVTFSDATASY